MTIDQLRIILAVVNEKSITAAAKKLHISQQALSKSLALLEEECSTSFFKRSASGTELTYIGKQVLPVIETLVKNYDSNIELLKTILGQNSFSIQIAVENELYLGNVQSELLSTIGNIRVFANIITDVDRCVDEVKNDNADIAIVCIPVGEDVDREFVFHPIYSCGLLVVFAKGHHLENKAHITIDDLANEGQIGISHTTNFVRHYKKISIEHGYYPRFTATYPTPEMVMKAVYESKNLAVVGAVKRHAPTKYDDLLCWRPLEDSPQFEIGFLVKRSRANEKVIQSYLNAVLATQ